MHNPGGFAHFFDVESRTATTEGPLADLYVIGEQDYAGSFSVNVLR